jgi:hypothetical protein
MSEQEMQADDHKRGPGRPRKDAGVERDPQRNPDDQSPRRFKMRATPNWESFDASSEETPDRLKIDPSLIPDGMSAQWVTDSIYGQSMAQHRAEFERKGWTPIHQDDFDGQFDGMFMPRGAKGEITVDGLVLMMRPKEITDRARFEDRRKAIEQVAIKEQALRGGDLPVSLDARHPSAVNSNRITKSVERIDIPDK